MLLANFLGRLVSIQYNNPSGTPDVRMAYDNAGNRSKMSEYSGTGFTSPIRETGYSYDDVRRLTSVGFDNDGGGTVDETVSYEYDAGGLRTKLTLPGSLNVVYTYDQRGQLVSLTDWDSQPTQFAHDLAGRLISVERANGLRSRYHVDAAGRLKLLRHAKDFRTLGHFEYQVDKRGTRTQALECLPHPTTTTDTTVAYNDKGLVLKGTWSEVSSFKESSEFSASLKLIFFGDEATLTMGTGPDHGIYDVYVGGALWQSFDGYSASASQRDILISAGVDSRKLYSEGPHLLEIRNRAEKNKTSTGYKVRFKQLVVADRTYDLHTIEYAYDNLSRLREARYNPGANVGAGDSDLLRRYLFTYDRAGNRLSESLEISGGGPTVTSYTYNGANQITNAGFSYDNNGNLLDDGPNTYSWDRANRLLSMGGISYKYDGEGRRIQQKTGDIATRYLLDLQPALATVLRQQEWDETNPGSPVLQDTRRFVHGQMGIHAQEDNAGDWSWMVQDGLRSVRSVVNNTVAVQGMTHYALYGGKFGTQGSLDIAYGFTGEPGDDNGLNYHRARYLNPALGVFPSLDSFEGTELTPMSLNRYQYVWANPINRVDASGKCATATYEAGQQIGSYMRSLPVLYNLNIDGALPETVGTALCAFEDGAQYVQQFMLGGYSADLRVEYLAADAIRSVPRASAVLGIAGLAILVGVGIIVSLGYPPVPYTPEQLEDMRPPEPPDVYTPTPTPEWWPQTEPDWQGTPAPAMTPMPMPAPMPYFDTNVCCIVPSTQVATQIAPTATATATATATRERRPPRGAFIGGTNDIILLGRTIPDGIMLPLSDAIDIIDLWMGEPPYFPALNEPDIQYTYIPSIDDGLTHSYRATVRDVNSIRPHFNLEAGGFGNTPGRLVPSFNPIGNLHLYFTSV